MSPLDSGGLYADEIFVKRILVCQHVAFELLGTLDPLFKSYGFRVRYVNFGREPHATPSLDRYHGLVLLGGPMSADDDANHPHLLTETELVRDAIERGIPVLGICLGAQLIARALGAALRPSPKPEIGWYEVSLTEAGREDPMLSHFAESEWIFQWHGDTFDIPDGAVHLASSSFCPNQAFRYGDRTYALQFHLEIDEALIERWLNVPVHREQLRSLEGTVDPDDIRRETRERIGRAKQLSDATFSKFVEHFGTTRRRHPHPHG
jgi:GMP synthase (glutamine-hydrolysing)